MLQFDPSKRLSAEEALSHAYVNQFHDPGVERKADFKVQVVIDDNEKKSTAVYRERLYHEITKMKRSSSAARYAMTKEWEIRMPTIEEVSWNVTEVSLSSMSYEQVAASLSIYAHVDVSTLTTR